MDEESHSAALERMKKDRESAVKLEDLAQTYLKRGADPRYIANRFGVDLERCQKYVAALRAQKEKA